MPSAPNCQPTAQIFVPCTAATPVSALPAAPGSGLGTIDHARPFHRVINVFLRVPLR
jgi:hypothetical protein